MIITCPQCQAQYRYDDARFGSVRRKRVKCPKCDNIFEVENPNPDEDADATSLGSKGAALAQPERSEPEPPELPALPPLRPDVRYSLAVIAGTQAGSIFPLTKPRVFLGRGSSMDIQVKDAEVSRRHAMLEIGVDDEATLVDLAATNGTFVSGEKIDRVSIGNQSEFTLGSTTLMFIVTHNPEGGM